MTLTKKLETISIKEKGTIIVFFLGIFLTSLLLISCQPRINEEFPIVTSTIVTSTTLQPTITQTTTPISIATLTEKTFKENLTNLLLTNGECDFPCLWGISHGSSIQKAYDLAPFIGKPLNLYGSSVYSYTLSLGSLNTPDIYIEFSTDTNQKVKNIEMKVSEPSRFKDYYNAFDKQLSIKSLLENYGKPSEILIIVHPRVESNNILREYSLMLIYELHGFGIEYSGVVDSEDPIEICSIKLSDNRVQHVLLFLQEPVQKINELNSFYLTKFEKLEEVTSLSLETIYTIISGAGNNQCIEISVDKWQ